MHFITRAFYGALIGVASIAPGLSGGTIAIALGFYEHLIHAIANLFKHFRTNFFYLLPYGIGGLISIACFSVAINYLFLRYPLPTNTLFIGFIIGTFPFIRKKLCRCLNGKNLQISHVMTMIVFFLIVLIPVFAEGADRSNLAFSAGPLSAAILAGIGMIIAAALVIPGLSGTMILTSLGCYKPLLLVASTFVTASATLDFHAAARQLVFILPLSAGVIVGGFLTAKLVSFLFQRIPAYVYSAIAGLILATPVVMLADVKQASLSLPGIGISLLTLLLGLILVRKLGE